MKNYSPAIAATGISFLACLAVISSAAAQSPTALTSQQVDCNADQLRAMSRRSALIFGPFHTERTATLLWTYGPPGGFQGLAIVEPFNEEGQEVAGENQLSFSVVPNAVKLLRNPARQQLDSVVVTRDDLNSDLSRFEQSHAVAVVVDPTIDPLKNEDPATLAVVDNLQMEEGGVASNSKPGRGMAAVLVPCHSAFSKTDLHVFGVLSRVVRAVSYTGRRTDPKSGYRSKLATIYRGEEATPVGGAVRTAYRIDFFPTGAEGLGRIAVEMLIDLGPDGTLGNATMRLLPTCTGNGQRHCTSAVSEAVVAVVRPTLGGQSWNLASSPSVCLGTGSACSPEVSFSFQDILQGTTWLRPN